jgi:protein tyrosine/serine phosphatase
MRHTKLNDHIWFGGELRPGDWDALHALGLRRNLSLQAEARDAYGKNPPEAELWLPAVDWFMPNPDQLWTAAVYIEAAVVANKPVLVHCKAGIGRAPLTVAAYLITQGMTLRDALALLSAKRPIVEPNQGQVEVVGDFERLFHAGVFER